MTTSTRMWVRLAPGYYESSDGHIIDQKTPGRWFITWPGRYAPDV